MPQCLACSDRYVVELSISKMKLYGQLHVSAPSTPLVKLFPYACAHLEDISLLSLVPYGKKSRTARVNVCAYVFGILR